MKNILLFLVLGACGVSEPLSFELGASAPASWSDSLEEALLYWKGCGYDVERGGASAVQVKLGATPSTLYGGWWDGQAITLRDDSMFGPDGQPPRPTWVTTLEDCQWQILVSEVIKHEMGHALGFGHSSARDSVMFEDLPWCEVRIVDDHCP